VGVPPPPPWPELAGKTLGILGYGHIGQALARRARAFDMTVLATRRTPAPESGVLRPRARGARRRAGPRGLPRHLTLPLSPETRGLLGARELGRMKRGAMLVNVARGEIVDEDALYQALADRQARRRRARCLVPLPEDFRADAAGAPAVPRAAQRADDPTRLRLDRGDAGGACRHDRRKHRARRARGEPPQNLIAR
jgi:hypothetical protein